MISWILGILGSLGSGVTAGDVLFLGCLWHLCLNNKTIESLSVCRSFYVGMLTVVLFVFEFDLWWVFSSFRSLAQNNMFAEIALVLVLTTTPPKTVWSSYWCSFISVLFVLYLVYHCQVVEFENWFIVSQILSVIVVKIMNVRTSIRTLSLVTVRGMLLVLVVNEFVDSLGFASLTSLLVPGIVLVLVFILVVLVLTTTPPKTVWSSYWCSFISVLFSCIWFITVR